MSVSELEAESDAVGWEAVAELPPSAKLVAKVLEYNERLTQSQLADSASSSLALIVSLVPDDG